MNNIRIVEDLYDAFGRKDEARLRELLAPEIEWLQGAGFPRGGWRRGVEEVLEKVGRRPALFLAGLSGSCRRVPRRRRAIPSNFSRKIPRK